jgi:hypothetical protein
VRVLVIPCTSYSSLVCLAMHRNVNSQSGSKTCAETSVRMKTRTWQLLPLRRQDILRTRQNSQAATPSPKSEFWLRDPVKAFILCRVFFFEGHRAKPLTSPGLKRRHGARKGLTVFIYCSTYYKAVGVGGGG